MQRVYHGSVTCREFNPNGDTEAEIIPECHWAYERAGNYLRVMIRAFASYQPRVHLACGYDLRFTEDNGNVVEYYNTAFVALTEVAGDGEPNGMMDIWFSLGYIDDEYAEYPEGVEFGYAAQLVDEDAREEAIFREETMNLIDGPRLIADFDWREEGF